MSRNDSRLLNGYYRQKRAGGRGIAARIIDFLALRLLSFACVYLYIRSLGLIRAKALFAALLFTLALCLLLRFVRVIRQKSFVAEERRRIAKRYIREKLMLMPKNEFNAAIDNLLAALSIDRAATLVYPLQRANEISSDCVLLCLRCALRFGFSQAVMISTSEFSKEAREFAMRTDCIRLRLVSPTDLVDALECSELSPSAEIIDSIILSDLREKRSARKKRLAGMLENSRAKSYLVTGIMLTVFSFFTAYCLYFRLIAGICFLCFFAIRGLSRKSTTDYSI